MLPLVLSIINTTPQPATPPHHACYSPPPPPPFALHCSSVQALIVSACISSISPASLTRVLTIRCRARSPLPVNEELTTTRSIFAPEQFPSEKSTHSQCSASRFSTHCVGSRPLCHEKRSTRENRKVRGNKIRVDARHSSGAEERGEVCMSSCPPLLPNRKVKEQAVKF